MKLERFLKYSLAWTKYSFPSKTVLPYFMCGVSSSTNLHLPQSIKKQYGFSYIEVMIAMFILAISIVPAMEAIQSGVQGAGIHESLTQQHYALVKRMEETQAEAYENLLNATQVAGNNTTPSSYSDSTGQIDRVLVFLALYDPNAFYDPFVLVDSDSDGDGNLYTGDTSNLLWLRVAIENSTQSMETLISR